MSVVIDMGAMIDWSTIINIAITIIFAILALIVHELAHVLAVNYLGGKVEKVGIFPFGLRARFRGLEKLHAWERYVIYGSGSCANIMVAAWTFTVSQLSYFGIPWLEELAFFNLALAIFNLLPVFPLDGGRICHQFLSNRLGMRRANRIMLKLGTCFVVALMFFGLLQVILYNYNITLLCAALYICQENKKMLPSLQLEFFQFLEAKRTPQRARLMPIRSITIPKNASLKYILDRLTMDHFTEFYTEKKTASSLPEGGVAGFRLPRSGSVRNMAVSEIKSGSISEAALLEHIFIYGLQGTVDDIIIFSNKTLPRLE